MNEVTTSLQVDFLFQVSRYFEIAPGSNYDFETAHADDLRLKMKYAPGVNNKNYLLKLMATINGDG